jgi:hypothetical protein
MKKILRRLRLVFGSYTEEELIRELVKIELNIPLFEEKDLDKMVNEMGGDTRDDFLSAAYSFYISETFRTLKNTLIQNFSVSTLNGASTMHHFICGKMSIYGINIFCEYLEKMAKRHVLERSEQDKINEEEEFEDQLNNII